jgi:hypothetical protein
MATTSVYAYFENINVDLAYGYFGKHEFSMDAGEIGLGIFEKFPIQVLEIEKADMTFSVTNGLGFPIKLEADVSTLTHNPSNPQKTFNISEELSYPRNPYEQPITETFRDTIQHLINDNSGYLPYKVEYSAKITINPNNNPTIPNFFSRNAFVQGTVGAEIPMKLRVGGLVVSDTINFGGLPISGGIEFFAIRANLHNAFPMDVTVYLYLMDEDYQIIDSIFARRIPDMEKRPIEITAAPVGSDGRVTHPAISQLEIPLEGKQIENLQHTKYFRIKGILNTSDWESTTIGVFEDSNEGYLKVMLGARIIVSGKLIDSLDDLRNDE